MGVQGETTAVSSWGEMNRVMNRLVAEGKIASFRSNASEVGLSGPIDIRCVPKDGEDTEAVRARALRELSRIGIVARVRMD